MPGLVGVERIAHRPLLRELAEQRRENADLRRKSEADEQEKAELRRQLTELEQRKNGA